MLYNDPDFLVAQPFGFSGLDAAPAVGERALYLATFHRELDVVRRLVAGDDLEFEAEHVARQDGIVDARGADAHSAHDDFGLARVIEGLDRDGVPDIADEWIGGDTADPREPGRFEGR